MFDMGKFGSSFNGGDLNGFDAMVMSEMYDDDYNVEELKPKKKKRKKYDPNKFSWEQDEDDDPRYSWEQDEDDDPRYSWER